jgi:hypothetical protein
MFCGKVCGTEPTFGLEGGITGIPIGAKFCDGKAGIGGLC